MEWTWLDIYFREMRLRAKTAQEYYRWQSMEHDLIPRLYTLNKHYVRFVAGDRRIEAGDDYDADAWINLPLYSVVWTPVGEGPPTTRRRKRE